MRDANKLHLLAHIATRLAEESAAVVPSESRLQFYESWFDEFLDWHFSDKFVPVVHLAAPNLSSAALKKLREIESQVRPIFLDTTLNAELDAITACGPSVVRHTSLVQTDECPIWNPFRGYWDESDEQLRERLKASLAETET